MNKPEFELPPLPPEVSALLGAERRASGPSPEVQARMFSKIGATLGLPGGPGSPDSPAGAGEGGAGEGGAGEGGVGEGGVGEGGAGGGGAGEGGGALPGEGMEGSLASGGASAAYTSAATHPITAAHVSTATTAAAALPSLLSKLVHPITVISFAVGAITGAGTHALLRSPPQARMVMQTPAPSEKSRAQAPAPLQRPRPVSPSTPVEPAQAEKLPGTQHVAGAAKISARASQGAGQQRTRALAKERQLIEVARTALARGRAEDALSALARHGKEFPRGRLAEERRALSILAQVARGSIRQARSEARDFRSAFPQSLLLPAIEQALSESTPQR